MKKSSTCSNAVKEHALVMKSENPIPNAMNTLLYQNVLLPSAPSQFDSNPIPDHLCKCVRECVLDPSQNSDPKPDQRVEPIKSIKSTGKLH
jgi:hypothetical protein